MSATAAPVAEPVKPRRAAILPRLVSFFSGSVGFGVKLALLALLNALDIWALFVLVDRRHWIAAAVLVAATVLVDWLYLAAPAKAIPWKFLVPGTVFLVAFQVVPIIYTIDVAFTNYSTGHITTKPDAIKQIQVTSLQPPPNGKQYTMAAARNSSGDLVLILKDNASGKTYVGSKKGLTPIPAAGVKTGALGITAATGYSILKGSELFSLDQTLQNYVVPVGKAGIRPEGISQAVELQPTLRWDGRRGVFTRISDGVVFRDDGKGSFRAANGEELEPGWKTFVGGTNFSRIWNDPQVRKPFIRVLIWTIAFATLTVFFSFAIGLFLAIALNKPGMRFLRLYRSALVIPWAAPGFLMLLVWQGLLNDDFGVVNRIFHVHVPWLFDANWAKVSVILVSVWLTVPYFFLVSLGALQSIPEELNEAARVDGGGPLQLFRRVTLPLLMVAVSPLLIASFAFNFNNFNNIYLLTSGGPPQGDNSIAGATDILISYTYKLAIQTGKGQDFGLAAAFTIVIFLIVATISAISFSRTQALENIN